MKGMDYRYAVTRGCTFCGTCEEMCPENAICIEENGAVIDQDKCVGCGVCYDNCAFEAIERITAEGGQRK